MKNPKFNPFAGPFGAAVCCLSGMTAHAAIIEKADNATALNPTGSWSGGTVPGSGDIASWSSIVIPGNTASLGGVNTIYSGISITSPGGPVTVDGAYILALGAAGIELLLRSGFSVPSCGESRKNHIERQPLEF